MAFLAGLEIGVAVKLRHLVRTKSTAPMEAINVLTDSERHLVLPMELHNSHVCGRREGPEDRDDASSLRGSRFSVSPELPDARTRCEDSVHATPEVRDA